MTYACSLFYFKHKTAYAMRIRDWSSDVGSSDLLSALWLAAALAALQFGLVWLGISSAKEDLLAAVRPAAVAQGLLCALAFVLLIWLFVHSDMSVKLVAKIGRAHV